MNTSKNIRDLHGCSLTDALDYAEWRIGRIRETGSTEEIEFITGFGVIREKLFELLESHSLKPSYKIGNEGAIIVTIE